MYANAVHEFFMFICSFDSQTAETSLHFIRNDTYNSLRGRALVLYTASSLRKKEQVDTARQEVINVLLDLENMQIDSLEYIKRYCFSFIGVLFVILLFFVFAVLIYASQLEKAKKRETESLSFNSKILQAQEAERSRISRELHDTVAQDMKYTAILAGKIPIPELSEQIRTNQTKCIDEIRAMCYNLSPPDIDTGDFESAVKTLCGTFKKQTGLQVRLSIQSGTDFSFLDNDRSLNVYRLLQECLNNVAHHAKAKEVTIFLRDDKNKNGLYLFITDDGCGIDARLLEQLNEPSGKITTSDGSEHFGVRGMKERIRLLGGLLSFNSMIDEGTEVVMFVPHKKN